MGKLLSYFDSMPGDFGHEVLCRMRNRDAQRVYICSPLNACETKERYQNIKATRYYMRKAFEELGVIPRALHAYVIYDDTVPAERAMALSHGYELLQSCEAIYVCGKRISNGMRREIIMATAINMPIFVFDPGMATQVIEIVKKANAAISLVQFNEKALYLGLTPNEVVTLAG